MSEVICMDRETKEEVDEVLCESTSRLRPHITECNTHLCPPFWIIESWSACSKRCGGGHQSRDVYCVQDIVNGTRVKVDDNNCPKQKPINQKSCNTQECPQWFEGAWSQCSVTCDTGYQTRPVVCRDVRGFYSNECNNETKPLDRQNCSTGIKCSKEISYSKENSQEDSPVWSHHSYRPFNRVAESSISTEPNYIVGEWSTCSVMCGKGIKKRSVDCKIFLEFSRTVVRLPDSQCPGLKPQEIDVCFLKDCKKSVDEDEEDTDDMTDDEDDDEDEDNNIINSRVEKPVNKMIPLSKIGSQTKYLWKSFGFTECTASCLGGTQESIISCVRDSDETEVSSYLCNINNKPDSFTRTCNDHPCPPRWNVSEYNICSKECGSGIQTRDVQCVHEVTRGVANTIIVANHMCKDQMPKTKQFCNVFDCPPKWEVLNWSQCSRSCGGGVKTRKLKCIKELAFGQTVEQSISKCPKKRPKAMKTCNSKPCRNALLELRKVIHDSKHNFESNKIEDIFIQKESMKRISLKVNGEAIIMSGTILRLRCPRRKTDKMLNQSHWLKNDQKIVFDNRIKMTAKNVLRIRNVDISDSGSYSCRVDNSSLNTLLLKVKHILPDEDNTVERTHLSHTKIGSNFYGFGKIVTNSDERSDTSHGVMDFANKKKILMRSKPKRAYNHQTNPNLSKESFSAESPVVNNDQHLDTFEVNYGKDENKEVISEDIKKYETNYNEDESKEKFRSEKDPEKEELRMKLDTILSDLKKLTKSQLRQLYFLSKEIHNNSYNSSNILQSDHHLLTKASIEQNINWKHFRFDWMTTEWSTCAELCGSTEYQVRVSQCYVIFENISKLVDNSYCLDIGLEVPVTVRNCKESDCPFWQTGQWSECKQCIDSRTGIQYRDVKCILNNGSIVDNNKCQSQDKPITQKQCVNDLCEPTWITGNWTQCNAKCNEEGFQSRTLQCVWFSSGEAAGNSCNDKTRPEVIQMCTNETCSRDECEDISRHCHLAISMNMCRIAHYKHQCCQSCKSQT
ncbi:protein madd-4-like isoform X2 [Oppia nitens]|nr:protein madd-4-like isoform X2 [Oppia nitens]